MLCSQLICCTGLRCHLQTWPHLFQHQRYQQKLTLVEPTEEQQPLRDTEIHLQPAGEIPVPQIGKGAQGDGGQDERGAADEHHGVSILHVQSYAAS